MNIFCYSCTEGRFKEKRDVFFFHIPTSNPCINTVIYTIIRILAQNKITVPRLGMVINNLEKKHFH